MRKNRDDSTNTNGIQDEFKMSSKNEIVLFSDGEVSLEVPISPEKETVWLNRQQMAKLFDRDVILSVGYRVNSQRGNKRIAATIFLHFLDRNGILFQDGKN